VVVRLAGGHAVEVSSKGLFVRGISRDASFMPSSIPTPYTNKCAIGITTMVSPTH
jgi:hypothetical protein